MLVAISLFPDTTYNVNASAKAALGLKLGQCLRRLDIFVDLGGVIHIDPSIVRRRGQEITLGTQSQSPMLASLVTYARDQPRSL